MKKVIEGKVYNTETAEELHDWSNHYPCSDFKACSESLYRTKKGAFFIAGSGGPLSSYAVPCGNGYGGGLGFYLGRFFVSSTPIFRGPCLHIDRKQIV